MRVRHYRYSRYRGKKKMHNGIYLPSSIIVNHDPSRPETQNIISSLRSRPNPTNIVTKNTTDKNLHVFEGEKGSKAKVAYLLRKRRRGRGKRNGEGVEEESVKGAR